MSKNWLIKGEMRLRSIYWQMVATWIVQMLSIFMMEKLHGQMNREWNGTKR